MSESRLRQAYELIRDPNRWTTGAAARDALGRLTSVYNPYATKFCAAGAVARVWGQGSRFSESEQLDRYGPDMERLIAVASVMFPDSSTNRIIYVNDHLGYEAVMQVFEKAIVELEGSL